jgi:hypothetical protein
MIRKISYSIIAVAILVVGYIAFNKINYWERSIRIFSVNNTDLRFEGRMGRGQGGFEGRFEAGRPERGTRDRNMPDSLRRQFAQNERNRSGRFPAEGGFRNGEGRGRGELPGGKKVRLANVMWFLAVFAAFTSVVIYIDKAYSLIRKRRQVN